jgi:hypothetical protein
VTLCTDHKEVECDVMHWIQRSQDGALLGSCDHGNETSGSIKVETFLDQLGYYQFLNK